MRLPREISPGAAARRALLADLLIALALALAAIALAAGIGIVGFAALLVLLALGAWTGVEAAIRRLRRPPRSPTSRGAG
ncbi:MAG TPA: hypothetical protein VII45_11770 [Solirubrobacterales bacterium]